MVWTVIHIVMTPIWTLGQLSLLFLQMTSPSGCTTDAPLSRCPNWTHLPPITSLVFFVSISWSKSETWVVTLIPLHKINHESYNFCLLNLIPLGSLPFFPSLLPLPWDNIISCIHYCKSADQSPWFLPSVQFQTAHCIWHTLIACPWWQHFHGSPHS